MVSVKNRRAFTLIELLVVVAIIGILAAVGVVAYNGYTSSAKVSTSKSNHNLVVKKISLTIQQCNIEGSVNIKYKYKDTNSYNVNCYPNKFTFFSDYLINDMDNEGRWKNPYKSSGNRVQQPGRCNGAQSDGNAGFVWIFGDNSANNVTVCTCVKTPCNQSSNRKENTFQIEW